MFGEKLFYRVISSLDADQRAKMQRAIVVKSAHLAQLSIDMIEAKRAYHAKRAMRPFATKKSIIENTILASAANRALKNKDEAVAA